MADHVSPLEQVPELQPSHYSDGHPLDHVHYLECKIILKPDRFTSKQGFVEFADLARRAAEKSDVDLSTAHLPGQRPEIREVVFLDTEDFRLYNNAFILRRRISYEDGFPIGDPEVVFKYRHPDLQKAAEMDVRPHIPGVHQIKFKAEALPLRDKLGGLRLLFSHNAEFSLSQVQEADRASMDIWVRLFPCLASLKSSGGDRIDLVNQTIVEEVLFDLGKLDFGKGVEAKSNAALWRVRGDHKPLIGEYSFQAKFDRRDELHPKVKRRCEDFFVLLQNIASDWVSLGTTKTGAVYRLNGNPPQNHE
ncbi:MAG TPA: hypothetical protein VMS64_12185 [Candidatus Methylomirabilis sp.]|nr:hypothetical protein [Candidatus Methylomirabilis sp.]